MFIPLKDDNAPRSTPYVNYALVFTNTVIYLYELTLGRQGVDALAYAYGAVPSHFVRLMTGHGHIEPTLISLFTSMFLHSTPLHLLGNMLFIWIFGDNVEDVFGHVGYLAFYLFCGVASGLTHILFNLHSSVPAIGASGAISGVLGAYLLLFPHNRILTLVLIFLVRIPAWAILIVWFVLQIRSATAPSFFGAAATGGIAWWAHIGGFLTGLLISAFIKRKN